MIIRCFIIINIKPTKLVKLLLITLIKDIVLYNRPILWLVGIRKIGKC